MGILRRMFGHKRRQSDGGDPFIEIYGELAKTKHSIKLIGILIELSRPARPSDMPRRVKVCQQALTLVNHKEAPALWAGLQVELGNALLQSPLGDRAENVELAISHYEQALEAHIRKGSREGWATVQNNLGEAYRQRLRGERAENIERAIGYYEQALQVRTRATLPVDWAATQNNLGIAFADRLRGIRADNLERAITHYNQALQVRTREGFPVDWAATQNNLGVTYRHRLRGERAENLEQAIAHCEQALQVRTRVAFPEDWAGTQNNLGSAYLERLRGERAENLEWAITHYNQALQVRTREGFPVDWAATQSNLGAAYTERIRGERAENLERAITHYNQAVQVYTRETFPEDWAMIQNNLGIAYVDRIRGERTENIEWAIIHYEQALQVYMLEAFPECWAMVQNNLGTAYLNRLRGEPAENLERAIAHYKQALQIRSPAAFPEDWAETQHNLGAAYAGRLRGERAENLERAIAHCEQALQVRTLTAFPEDWAATNVILGNAFCKRLLGERIANLEQAIAHYEQALTVYTFNAYPRSWALTHGNLGIAYSDRLFGDRAENLEQAISHSKQALQIYTRESSPEDWARTQNNLGTAYDERLRGERDENLEQAIAHYERALQVYTRTAFQEDWAKTQVNLGNAYAKRLRTGNLNQAFQCLYEALSVLTLERFPADFRRVQKNLGHLHFSVGNWDPALASYAAAIAAGDALLAAAFTETGRRAEIRETAGLHAAAAYCLLRLQEEPGALATLEHGKTRLLSEALALDELDLRILPEDQQAAVQNARQTIGALDAEMRLPPGTPARRSDRALATALQDARSKLNDLIDAIRAQHPDFLPKGLDSDGLLSLVPAGGALVAPLVTTQGGAAFVLRGNMHTVTEENIVWLDTFNTEVVNELLRGTEADKLGGWLGAYANRPIDPKRWFKTLDMTGRQLWEVLLGPIHERLAHLGLAAGAPVVLMPQGGLGLLPLHAAWREVNGAKRYFLDDYTVSYAPSGYALAVSKRRLREPKRRKASLLAVINPTADLRFTPAEGEAVLALFDPSARHSLTGAGATVDAVVRAAPGRSYVHFSCHGFYNWLDAMRSGLLLAQGVPLTLAQIITGLDLSATRLVTLSACETGITNIRQSPDEYLGLPAGFLQAGAPAVISTLWAVDDLSTALLMERFYRHHLREGMDPAAALRQAQRWLRDVTAREVAELLQGKERELGRERMAWTDIAPQRRRMEHQYQREDRPFAHPYYWAGVQFVGA